MSRSPSAVRACWLGSTAYREAWDLQAALVSAVREGVHQVDASRTLDHVRARLVLRRTTFQSLYVVTKAKHFTNPCFIRQFYSSNWLATLTRRRPL